MGSVCVCVRVCMHVLGCYRVRGLGAEYAPFSGFKGGDSIRGPVRGVRAQQPQSSPLPTPLPLPPCSAGVRLAIKMKNPLLLTRQRLFHYVLRFSQSKC